MVESPYSFDEWIEVYFYIDITIIFILTESRQLKDALSGTMVCLLVHDISNKHPY